MAFTIKAGAFIKYNNKVLLLQLKGEGDQNGKWGPPSGGGMHGETTEQTAIREIKEETNLDVLLKGLVQVIYSEYKNKNYLFVFYLAEAKNLKGFKIQEEECSGYAWASLEDIENDKYILRKKFLKESLILAFKQEPADNNLLKAIVIEV